MPLVHLTTPPDDDGSKAINKAQWVEPHVFDDGPDTYLLSRDSTQQATGGYAWVAPPGATIVFSATKDLTNLQLQTLNTVPIEIVAAPGAGFVIVPVSWTFEQAIGLTDFGASPDIFLQWGAVTTRTVNAITLSNGVSATRFFMAVAASTSQSIANTSNKPLNISSSADTPSAGSGTFRVTVKYYVVNMF